MHLTIFFYYDYIMVIKLLDLILDQYILCIIQKYIYAAACTDIKMQLDKWLLRELYDKYLNLGEILNVTRIEKR